MSEPNSLFARIKIKKVNFNTFLKAKPTIPNIEDGWIDWWENAEMYDDEALTAEDVISYEAKSNKEIVDFWINQTETITFSDYDEKNEIWHFGMLLFSENYKEMVPMLAFLRSLDVFKENENSDFILIYNYLWSDDKAVSAYLKFTNQQTVFIKKATKKAVAYAEKYLDKIFEKMQNENEESVFPYEENSCNNVDAIFYKMTMLPFVLFQENAPKNTPELPVFENKNVENFAKSFQNLCEEGIFCTKNGNGAKMVDALTAMQNLVKTNESLKIEFQPNDTLKLQDWVENLMK